jgi:hypothetical protein
MQTHWKTGLMATAALVLSGTAAHAASFGVVHAAAPSLVTKVVVSGVTTPQVVDGSPFNRNWVGGRACIVVEGLDICGQNFNPGVGTSGAIVSYSAGSSRLETYTCEDGAWVMTSSSGTCTAVAPPAGLLDCAAANLSWSSGSNNCTGTVSAQAPGVLQAVPATGVNTGTADFLCVGNPGVAGTWTQSGPGTCVSPPPPPPPGTITMNFPTTVQVPGTAHYMLGFTNATPTVATQQFSGSCDLASLGQISWPGGMAAFDLDVTETTAARAGCTGHFCVTATGTDSATLSACRDVNYVAAPPASCGSAGVSWSVGGVSCAGTAGSTTAGNTQGVGSTNGHTGSATYTCNSDGSFSLVPGSESCTASPPASCGSAGVSWSVGGVSCAGTAGSTTAGNTQGVGSTNGNTGSATYTCNGDGSFSLVPGSEVCNSPPPAVCNAAGVSWSVGGVSCAGTTGSSTAGNTQGIGSTNGNSGSAIFACNNDGSFSLVPGSESCAVPPPAVCNAAGVSWSVGGVGCASSTATTTAGTIQGVGSANGNSGSANYVCNNDGSFSLVPGSESCVSPPPPPPVVCGATGVSWTVGGVTCTSSTGMTTAGTPQNVGAANGNIGSATYMCNGDGSVSLVPGSESCVSPPPPPPSNCSGDVSWTANSYVCSASGVNLAHGATADFGSSNGTPGAANYSCNNGTLTLNFVQSCGYVDSGGGGDGGGGDGGGDGGGGGDGDGN